ncbi:MAG: sigma-70 family RNA polymerase sigma factor [Janthinobacterium lividum]
MAETADRLDLQVVSSRDDAVSTVASVDSAAADWQAFNACRARIYASAYRVLGRHAEAEDVVQDTFLKWQAADTERLEIPAAWLTTVATRLAIDRLRRLGTEHAWQADPHHHALQLPLDAPGSGEPPSPETLVEQRSMLAYGIGLLLRHLSHDECMALLLHEAFDADYRDIAKLSGRTPAHCRQLAHRAKQKLASRGPGAAANTANAAATNAFNAAVATAATAAPNAVDPARAEPDAVAPWVTPIVDAIARQDRQALIDVLDARAEAVTQTLRQRASAAAAMNMHAALGTASLMVRLRRGSICLA